MTAAGRRGLRACKLAWVSTGVLVALPAFAVRLQVVAPDGKPAAGAVVRGFIDPATRSLIEIRRGPVANGTTDAAGNVDLALPAVPRLVLAVDAPGLAPQILPVDSAAAIAAPWRIALDAGAILRGKAVGEGALSGRACVAWQHTVAALGQTLDFERCGELGAAGDFVLSGLDPGSPGVLTLTAPGYLPLAVPWPAEARAFRLTRGTALQGVVLGPGDRPVPGARLTGSGVADSTTDAAGRFDVRVSRLPVRLAVQAPGFRRREITVQDAAPVRCKLEPGATLQARVLDAAGKPVDKVALRLRRQTEANAWTREEMAVDAPRGDLLLDLAVPGRYRFEVSAPGRRPFASEVFAVSRTQGVNLGVVTLSAGGGIEGWVTSALTGRPLPGVLVTLWPEGLAGLQRAVLSTAVPQAVTDGEGRYRIVGQAEGAFELRFERAGFSPVIREVALRDDVILPGDEQRLGTGVRVHGKVQNRAGKARPGVQVRFLAASGSSRLPIAEATTGEQGDFSGVALAAGSYRVEVKSDRTLLAQTVAIEGGKGEQDLDLRTPEAAASGTVLHRGQPVAGGLLTAEVASLATPRIGQLLLRTPEGGQEVFGPSGSPRFEAEVGADGSFSFDDLPPGRLAFTYDSPEGTSLSRLVDLPVDGATGLAIDFSGARIQGLARLRQTREPVSGVAVDLRDGEGNLLGSAVSGADGSFAFDDVGAPDVSLEASKTGLRSGVSRLSLQGRTAAEVQLDLDSADTGSVTVRLYGDGGQPLSFAFVTLLTEGGALVRSLPLDALGSRQLEDVAAGTYRMVWTDPVFGVGASAPVLVRSGEEAVVEQRLQPPAFLDLVCQSDPCKQSPLEGLALFAAPGLDVASLLPGFSPGLAVSADGRLSLGAIQPGDYQMSVRSAGAPGAVAIHALSGQRVRIPIGPPPAPVAGRIAAASPR